MKSKKLAMLETQEIYIGARRVLLDALEALVEHRKSIVVVGAQAVYLHAGSSELAISPYTKDADLAINPMQLSHSPEIFHTMTSAGFELLENGSPGQWTKSIELGGNTVHIPVDLMVPSSFVTRQSRRSAKLDGHNKRVARKVDGIEAVLIDNGLKIISGLESNDCRQIAVSVAGPASLIIAKSYKIHERQHSQNRFVDKDALDVYRLIQSISSEDIVTGLLKVLNDSKSHEMASTGIRYFVELFSTKRAAGLRMISNSLDEPSARVEQLALDRVGQILEGIDATDIGS